MRTWHDLGMHVTQSQVIILAGTAAVVIGVLMLVLGGEPGSRSDEFLAALLIVGGLLLRIEGAIRSRA
jgi:hypothetical protein